MRLLLVVFFLALMLLDEWRRVEEGVSDVEHLWRGGRGRLLDLATVERLHALRTLLVLELLVVKKALNSSLFCK